MKTNKLFLFTVFSLMLIASVSALSVTESHGETLGSSSVTSGFPSVIGSEITVFQDILLTNVTKHTLATPTRVTVYNSSYGQIGENATFSFDVATFSTPILLEAGNTYYITVMDDGTYNSRQNIAVTYPINNTYFSWTNGFNAYPDIYYPSSTGHMYSIVSLTFDDLALVESVDITLNSPTNNSELTENNVSFNATITAHNNTLSNATLYLWNDGGSLNRTDFITLSNNEAIFSLNISDGSYIWNVYVCAENVSTSCGFSDSNRTFTFQLPVPIIFKNVSVTLSNPNNNENLTAIPILFSGIISPANVTLVNATLYIWNVSMATIFTSTLDLNSSEVDTPINYSINISDGTYTWNIYACGVNNTEAFCNFATITRTLNLEVEIIVPPVVVEEESGTVIYNILVSSGAGLGIFMGFMAQSIPFILIALIIIAIFFAVGYSIKKLLNLEGFNFVHGKR